jgi:curved DNA-binding protein CbpA
VERARPDYYRVLQVDPAANPLVIQAAYRALAQIFHPDVFGDEDEMKQINAAWEILGDPRRRREYDIERAGRHPGAVARESAPAHQAQPARPAAPATAPADSRTPGTQDAAAAGQARTAPRSDDHAGPPQGTPFGPVLRFGRYEGWTLGQVARVDRPWLEWLRRVPAGRGLKDEIDAVLRTRKGPGAVDERRHYEANQQKVHTWAPGASTKIR